MTDDSLIIPSLKAVSQMVLKLLGENGFQCFVTVTLTFDLMLFMYSTLMGIGQM